MNTGFNVMLRIQSSFGCVYLQTTNIQVYTHRKRVHCILRNLVYFEYNIFLWPYLTLVFMDGSVFMCTKNPRTSFFLGGGFRSILFALSNFELHHCYANNTFFYFCLLFSCFYCFTLLLLFFFTILTMALSIF